MIELLPARTSDACRMIMSRESIVEETISKAGERVGFLCSRCWPIYIEIRFPITHRFGNDISLVTRNKVAGLRGLGGLVIYWTQNI